MNIQTKINLIKALAKQRSGFTLIELLISLFLIVFGLALAIVIITAIVVGIHFACKHW